MKKFLGLVLAGVMALALSTAVDAASGLRTTEQVKNITHTIDGGDIKMGTVNIYVSGDRYKNSYGEFYYLYSNGLQLNLHILEQMVKDIENPYTSLIEQLYNLNPAVGSELAATGVISVYDHNGILFGKGGLTTEKAMDTAAGKISNWGNGNINSITKNIVPGRTAAVADVTGVDDGNIFAGGETVGEVDLEDEGSEEYGDIKAGNGTYKSGNVGSSSGYSVVGGKLVRASSYDYEMIHYDFVVQTATKKVSPIVLDMTGSGMLEASNGQHLPHASMDMENVIFTDFFGDGFEIGMEWVGPNDGLLVAPKADGTVDMSCLFGTAGGYESGYEQMWLLDKNADNVLSGEELAGLAIWQDKNGNGVADAGEVTSLSELGISKLNIDHKMFVSSFERNGQTYKMWDWFPSAMELQKLASK